MHRCLVPLLLALTACSSNSRVVRVDTGQGAPIVQISHVRVAPVKLDEGEFKRALADLAREMNVSLAPQEAARQLLEVAERSGWYQYDPHTHRIIPLGSGEHVQEEWTAVESELTRSYLAWCDRRGTRGDCLRLLGQSPVIAGDGRYALAMSFAKGAVLDEMEDAFRGMANREAILSAVLWTCTTYLLLLTVPEPVSKGIAAVMTAALIAWVGLDTFWSLIVGFKHMVEEADRAGTFAELRQAGERYGKVMGRNAARAFVMLATAAMGNTAAGFAAKLPALPGAVQAATQAGPQLGIRLSAVGAVTAVSVSADAVTLSVASGMVMPMAAHDGTGGPKAGSGKSANGGRAPAPENYRGRYNASRAEEGKARLPEEWDAHHRIPQEYRAHPEFKDFDFDAPQNIQGIKGSRADINVHQRVTNLWVEFREKNPHATRRQIEEFAWMIDEAFQQYWWK